MASTRGRKSSSRSEPTDQTTENRSQGSGSPAPTVVDVQDIYFAYGKEMILSDISFSMSKREVVSLIGPSGCGKSTLLKVVQGLLQPNWGRVIVDGEAVDSPSGNRAMIFQHFALLPWKTILRNVELGMKYDGVSKTERADRARAYLRLVGLEGSEDLYPHQLSGGMQQRVGIARAFAVDAAVLLLDEPFGALDAQNAEIMRGELSRLVEQEHRTALMVTHNLDEALVLTDRVIVMGANPGVILEDVSIAVERGDRKQDEWATSPEYRQIRERLWSTLRDEVLKVQSRRLEGGRR